MKKKIVWSVLILIGCAFPFKNCFATGLFTLISPQTLPPAILNLPYSENINFVYSGSAYSNVSLIGTALPDGVKLGAVSYGINGVDSIELSGKPTVVKDYPITLILTDNSGATLTHDYVFSVRNPDLVYSISSTTLPDAQVNEDYSTTINLIYYTDGYSNPSVSFMGLPLGINPRVILGTVNNSPTVVPMSSSTVVFSGTAKIPGHYDIKILISGTNKTLSLDVIDPKAQPQTTVQVAPVISQPIQPIVPLNDMPERKAIHSEKKAVQNQIQPKATATISQKQDPDPKGIMTKIGMFLDGLINSIIHLF